MCCLFGLIDYSDRFSVREKNHIIAVLSKECEMRGTDATGIAYNTESGLKIFKRPLPAHKMWYHIPASAKVIMGHTRMTTQGSEELNFNNHPFYGYAGKTRFALAHNGVLYNDVALRNEEKLPDTCIQTDSYVAVQLIEKENTLGFDSLRKMAEKTKGSFCFTVLDDMNNTYFVKGDNPLAIYKFNGFYIYASTEDILDRALKKLNFKRYSKVNLSCGDILKIDSIGRTEIGQFRFCDPYESYFSRCYGYDYDEEPMGYLMDYAGYFGITSDDIVMLLDWGYNEFDIEEMLYHPDSLTVILDEMREIERVY